MSYIHKLFKNACILGGFIFISAYRTWTYNRNIHDCREKKRLNMNFVGVRFEPSTFINFCLSFEGLPFQVVTC